MRPMTDIYSELVELKKKKMEIEFVPISARDKSFIKNLRELKSKIAALSIQLHKIRRTEK